MASEQKPKKLIVIDGHALVHRAWHAIPPLTTKSGELVNAVYGFTSILLNVLKQFQPEYIAVTFDRKEATFRHEEYKEYKATRVKQPDELYAQVPRIKEVVEAFGIPIYEKAGFEADDLIGTICALKSVDRKDVHSIVVTGDLDTLQLVDDNTFVYALKKGISEGVLYDAKAVKERYGLKPGQLIDYKALRGDPSDNIPGVKGIGEKTASELIKNFGSLEGVYENVQSKKISDRVRAMLEEQKEQAFLSKKLVTIVTDVKTDFQLDKTEVKAFDTERLVKLFQELDFKTLVKKIPGAVLAEKNEDESKKKAKTEGKRQKLKTNFNYFLIDDEASFADFFEKLKKEKMFSVDTETTSLNPFEAELLGISFSWKKGEAYYVVTSDRGQGTSGKIQIQNPLRKLKPILEDEGIKKIGHNIKYDMEVFAASGIALRGVVFDTMIASYLLDPGSRGHGLDNAVFSRYGHQMISFEDLTGKGRERKDITEVATEDLATYSCEDADFTFRLRADFEKDLEKEKLTGVFQTLEMPLVQVLAAMEEEGIKIDSDFLKKMSKEVTKRLQKLSEEIYTIAGTEFNISSPLQLKEVLFEKLGVSSQGLKKTKTGISTAAPELEKLRGKHAIIDSIFEHRELSKLKSTYLDALPKLVSKKNGRVHTSFNQTVTATGRLSSSNPNLQNIPIRTELGREIRKAFIAEGGNVILAADYSQFELRILAHLADDKNMIEVFRRGEDIHTSTAAKIWNVKPKDVTKEMRRAAKAINFGISYGMGPRALAQNAGVSFEEAKLFIDQYFALYGNVKKYMDEAIADARKKGYVATPLGRKRYLPDLRSGLPQLRAAAERMAINMPVQGTNADVIKLAMIQIYKELPKVSPETKMILQVHDELVFEAPERDAAKVRKYVKETMENTYALKVPIVVEVGVGKSWGELEK